MQLYNGKLLLSPSDLANYLACQHLTTLELETAHGTRTKPHIREALAQLVADKGDLHEKRYRYRIDREQLSEFLTRQVRLVERLPVESGAAAADCYGDGPE